MERPKRFDKLHRLIPQLERLNKGLPRKDDVLIRIDNDLLQVNVLSPLEEAEIMAKGYEAIMTERDTHEYRALVEDDVVFHDDKITK